MISMPHGTKKNTKKNLMYGIECQKVTSNFFGCFYEIKYLINHLKKNPNLSLLDIGCATGQLLRYLKLKKVLVDYFGVDISESCIQKAQEIHEKNCFKKITTQNLKYISYESFN